MSSSSSSLSSLSASFPSPTSSPILIDTLVLFIIQTGYYLLSRRFLLHALPTLRQISKRAPEGGLAGGEGAGDDDDGVKETGILGLPTLVGGNRTAEDDEDDDGGMINASGGLSDNENHNHQRSSDRQRDALLDDMDDSDTDSVASYAAGAPSPNPSARPSLDAYPLLPLHSQQQQQSTNLLLHPSTTTSSPQIRSNSFQPDLFSGYLNNNNNNKPKSPSISIPGKLPPTSSSSTSGHTSHGQGRRATEPRKKVLKLFHGRNRAAGAGGGAGADGERVRTTRGLGWLARSVVCYLFCSWFNSGSMADRS
jgi:hypothetical protein